MEDGERHVNICRVGDRVGDRDDGGMAYDGGMRNRKPGNLALVVAAARKALTDLDQDEVPGAIARVAAQTGRRLVPPLERRLLDEIEGNEWLRDRVTEQFAGSVDAADPYEAAAALFLYRPQGWEGRLEEITRRSQESEHSDRMARLTQRIDELESELETWRNSAKRFRREAEEAAAKSDRRVAAARAEARTGRGFRRLEILSRENRCLEKELAVVTAQRDEARERLSDTRGELEKERRMERSTTPPPAPSAWADLDPLGAARFLDDVAEALSPTLVFADTAAVPVEDPLGLPRGMAPDDRSAIEWLLTLDRSFAVLVDGYNVAYHVDRARFNTPEIRRRLENDLARFKGLARGRPGVTVVYDSAQSGDTTSDSLAGGVEVRFTSSGHTADDELVALAADLGASAVVVSSDRTVRERAQESGSLGLWSEALAGWILNS